MADENEATAVKKNVTIEDIGPCKKKVVVEIPKETIKNVTDEQYESLRKDAVVPGFRRGRAPRRLLEKRFGKETSEQIKLKLLADASESALKDKELDVLGEPDIDFEKIELPPDGALKFDFEIEVRPEFELPKLEGIKVERKKLEVTDEQIDREIEQLRRYSGLWAPKDEAAEAEDKIIADVALKAEDAQQTEKLEGVEVFVRHNGFVGQVPVENLDVLLAGANRDDVRQTTVNVPRTFFREQYRGKKVDLKISIREVKFLKPAALDAQFLSRFGVDDENQLRERIKDQLHSRLESQLRNEMTEQIYKYLLDNTDFDLPLDVVADQADSILQRQYISLLRQGLSKEQIEQHIEKLRSASEDRAKEQLKILFIMGKVAKQLGIEVTEEEINGYIAQMAIQRGQRPERMREQMVRDGSIDQFEMQIREEKCVSSLLETARIVEARPVKAAKKQKKKAAPNKKSVPKKTARSKTKEPKKAKNKTKKKTSS